MSDGGPYLFTVADDQTGVPLVDLVRALVGPAAEEVIAHGGLWLNKRRVADATEPAPPGGQVIIHQPPDGRYAEVVMSQEDILYEDEWLLALNKRQGWYCGVVPWDLYGNALAALGNYLEQRDGGVPYLHMAHQLDRDTSGVLLFSRRPEANRLLHAAFRDRTAHKRYLCMCVGVPPDEPFELQTGHGRASGGRFRVYPLDEVGTPLPTGGGVKLAHTRFRTLRQLDDAALVEANPLTGRTHQIRLHLAHLGHPLLGDIRYGGPAAYGGQALPGHLLHAAQLTLPHPANRTPFTLSAPLPTLFITHHKATTDTEF